MENRREQLRTDLPYEALIAFLSIVDTLSRKDLIAVYLRSKQILMAGKHDWKPGQAGRKTSELEPETSPAGAEVGERQ